MQSDESTLAESIDESLLRAGFALGDDYVTVLRTNLRSPVARHRVLALRGAVRQQLTMSDDWRSALGDVDDPHVRQPVLPDQLDRRGQDLGSTHTSGRLFSPVLYRLFPRHLSSQPSFQTVIWNDV